VTHRFAAKAGTVPAAVKRLRLYDALSCQAGASDNKGRSRVTIAPPKWDQMYLAAGHRASTAHSIERSDAEAFRNLVVRISK